MERSSALNIDSVCMAIGEVSVGLPSACSVDTMLQTYLQLVANLRPGRTREVRQDDVRTLADFIGLDVGLIKNHLTRLDATATA